MTGRRWRQQKARPPAPSGHRRQPKTPVDRTAGKRFYGNPGDHVIRPNNQLRLTSAAAPLCPPFCPASSRPRLLRPAPPLCGESAPAHCVRRAPSLVRAPGGSDGAVWVAGAELARGRRSAASAHAQNSPSRDCRRRPRAEEGSEGPGLRAPAGLGCTKSRTQRRPSPPVRIRDVEEHGVVGPVPEGGRG